MLKASKLDLDPKKIYYKDQKELETHQDRLKSLLKSAANTKDSIKMWTSGTSSSLKKMYLYTRSHHAIIEDYHISRIMHFNGWEPGTALLLKAVSTDSLTKPCDLNPLSAPYELLSLGKRNRTVDLYYRTDYNAEDWNKTFKAAQKASPSFLYCRPSEILLMRGADKAAFPVLTSMELLYDYIRNCALELFTDCVDKMRCWDGGLSFFECRYKTKHINDELCLAEEKDGKIFSTDFFNHSQKFVEYHNGDMGEIEIGACECGIFGRKFGRFSGRSMEMILSHKGPIPGYQIADAIFYASDKAQSLSGSPFNFCVLQHIDRNVEFGTDKPLDDKQKAIIKGIFANIDSSIKVEFGKLAPSEGKKCFIVSEASKAAYSPKE
jgi:hypothetical protein